MPPSSSNPLIASLSRQPFLGSSPDNDSGSNEPELQPKLSKKARKKQARSANALLYDDELAEKTLENNVTEVDPPPAPPPPAAPALVPASSLLTQIPHSFPKPQKISAPPLLEEQYGDVMGEKVSDQFTPPKDNFFQETPPDTRAVEESVTLGRFGHSPPVRPGFSTRSHFNSRSPPISPPSRYARPVSYGSAIPPPMPAHPRISNRPDSRATSSYGSPPAPHLPQPHFYHAHDVDVPLPGQPFGAEAAEPTLVKHTTIPSSKGASEAGILLGYDGRISCLVSRRGKYDEIGAISGLSGMVVDALMLPATFSKQGGLVAVVLHGSRSMDEPTEDFENVPNIPGYPVAATTTSEYVTSVEIYSLQLQQHIATIFESQPLHIKSYRGISPEPPLPIGNFRLFASGKNLVIASGTSGEVFIVTTATDNSMQLECVAKLWTNVQHQTKRRDSSHSRTSDTDSSPADINRGIVAQERAVIDINGRWLAISPASLPSRPSLNVRFAADILCRQRAGIETITAPTKPSISCEVDSPDVDSMLGKVARGVAQELVKGAKWLGDQGYQTWQSYWKKDQSPPSSLQHQHQPYNPPTFPVQRAPNAFPPTHAEALPVSKEPEVVSIYDLYALSESSGKQRSDKSRPVATFQPPRGCSFLSFGPTGLNLLTAGRKGDVQYVWDLMQIHYCRAFMTAAADDRIRSQPRVRQVARFERLSGSTIVDVVWETPSGSRFAVLTRNRTVHIFDLPTSSFRWPPPRNMRRARQNAQSVDNSIGISNNNQGGFFASAMNIASKAQPMVTGWRGRAPSMGGGLAGIGQTGIGIATATGARGGKAVAAGLSKSLGAASETVSHIRHAGESRLHIRSHHEPLPGRIAWTIGGRETGLSILDAETVKLYRVRKTTPQDRRNKEPISVFDSQKAVGTKLPQSFELRTLPESTEPPISNLSTNDDRLYPGFYSLDTEVSPLLQQSLPNPLSYAEIETNAPYHPFHSDRRVDLCIFADTDSSQSPSPARHEQWVFGDEIPVLHVNLARAQIADDDDATDGENYDSVIYRETKLSGHVDQDGMEQIVSTTRRGKKKRAEIGAQQDEDDAGRDDFFEDDCEVLDFATDRV